MAELSDLPLHYRLWLSLYPWRVIDPVPWTALTRPLSEARLALVSSAGLYRNGVDAPFARRPGGDASVRWIPSDVPAQSLAIGQTSEAFDRTALEQDRNEAWPVDRLGEAVGEGLIGALNHRHVSFNGSITAPGRLVHRTAPVVATALRADAVDVALLVPV